LAGAEPERQIAGQGPEEAGEALKKGFKVLRFQGGEV
jgi:hypothetical protein